jgi:DNA-binding transcriptional ArsR family regulator
MSQPARIQILLVLGAREACVCHLETALEMSQASISQHLMILRKHDLVAARRDGRHIYYSMSAPKLLDVIRTVANLYDVDTQQIENLEFPVIPGCPCPQCNPQADIKKPN